MPRSEVRAGRAQKGSREENARAPLPAGGERSFHSASHGLEAMGRGHIAEYTQSCHSISSYPARDHTRKLPTQHSSTLPPSAVGTERRHHPRRSRPDVYQSVTASWESSARLRTSLMCCHPERSPPRRTESKDLQLSFVTSILAVILRSESNRSCHAERSEASVLKTHRAARNGCPGSRF